METVHDFKSQETMEHAIRVVQPFQGRICVAIHKAIAEYKNNVEPIFGRYSPSWKERQAAEIQALVAKQISLGSLEWDFAETMNFDRSFCLILTSDLPAIRLYFNSIQPGRSPAKEKEIHPRLFEIEEEELPENLPLRILYEFDPETCEVTEIHCEYREDGLRIWNFSILKAVKIDRDNLDPENSQSSTDFEDSMPFEPKISRNSDEQTSESA